VEGLQVGLAGVAERGLVVDHAHLEHGGALDDLEQAAEVARLLEHLVAGVLGDACRLTTSAAASVAGVRGERSRARGRGGRR
jgi:hypothetical protein